MEWRKPQKERKKTMSKIAKMENGQPEIYLAVQGEGKTIGKPMVFVRFSLCNLHCNFCDTFYTWNFEHTPWEHDFAPKCSISKEQIDMTEEEIVAYIKKVAAPNKAVVFTGGEPMLHGKAILRIIQLLGKGWYFEIETNGTIPISQELLDQIDQVNCSPKLASSGNPLDKRFNYDVLSAINRAGGIFKFVIKDDVDLQEVEKLIKSVPLNHEQIYLMPCGITRKEILEGSIHLNNVCMQTGYNMSTRLQVILYDNKRAV